MKDPDKSLQGSALHVPRTREPSAGPALVAFVALLACLAAAAWYIAR